MNYKSLLVPTLVCVFCMQNSGLWTSIQVSIGTRLHLSFCACTRACLASELLVSMDATPHQCFFTAKQRVLYPNNDSLCVPDLTCHFVLEKKAWLVSESLISMGPWHYLWLLHANQRLLEQNYKSIEVPVLSSHFVHAKQRNLHQNDKSICVPALVCGFVHAKQQI